ncbi:formylmethanofuran--tetrahydromethanopterin N-formyltransferase [Methanoplanus sp. FWC-SCC4]|uniref:Formylmethanofuran--tetrahydromethanopterin formyltransferase n=1 Tax=Methanochimaera problematica TaxID=2609417 RepID=A0AA97F9H8_9EURY|nr:formylmethanofuran--tetrahydromethanopterin N-formyltransferase [Methanoplanus sp. FWC-SCC4]WOF15290.1 formylmethanofuran--tetrahydromethanopterin N-formyltransferase [Methanoplanus sp. FWC-SCC4]
MELNGVIIEDEYAEAFPNWSCRVIITAINEKWAYQAATEATGFATSAIGCPCEAGIEMFLSSEETPDGRPGVAVLFFAGGKKKLKEQVVERLAECVLTQPTTAVFDGMPDAEERIDVKLHFFGDGFEYKKEIGGRSCWAIPIMNGEYVGEENFGIVKGIAGGNFFIMGESQPCALMAAEAAIEAIYEVPGCMCSFPVVASGSKVGSNKYKFMPATTNEKYCPSIRDKVEETKVPEGVQAVYEIVIDGVDEEAIKESTRAGIVAASKIPGIKLITAGNFGGNLGPYKFNLHEIL